MKLAFSTLGCPHWQLEQIAQAAHKFGYQAIELRALGGDLDLLARPEFQPRMLATTRQWFADEELSVCCVDSSCSFDAINATERREQVEIAVKHCQLASALGARLIRVFPNEIPASATREETRDRIAESLREVARQAPPEILVGLETHGDFARGESTAEIVSLANHENVVIVWDVANAVAAGDSVTQSVLAVAKFLAHVHLRDARHVDGRPHWQPVLAGHGSVPFATAVDALSQLGYSGYISFEWEKYWQPEIEEPEIALPDFMNAMTSILRDRVNDKGASVH